MASDTGTRRRPLDPLEPIHKAAPELKRLIKKLLKAEKDKLYMDRPRDMEKDLLKIIKDEIRDPGKPAE